MKKIVFILTILLTVFNVSGQTVYSGFIDKYPIELVTDISNGGPVKAIYGVYSYSGQDDPIIIDGVLQKGKAIFYEKDKNYKNRALLSFENFDTHSASLEGTWTDLRKNRKLKISLAKSFDINYGDSVEWTDREILQSAALDNQYFKLLVSKVKGRFYPSVTGVKIFEKKTDKLLQKILVESESLSLDNISVGDYNFDGIKEFSVFENFYAGPNTSRIYFLFDTAKNTYFRSDFAGVSLTFDDKQKNIFELNQCCGGRQYTTATYKVVNNKMVLIEQHCYIWSEEKKKMIERKMQDCE
ncbi:MAG: hypothetical protein EPO58_12815 [Chitinophagaceae bacterium]|nr:MAG: hypothetical protein EPO58_12815 [Chitinophagaceae bacterium]